MFARITANAGAGIWLDAARYADSDGYEKDKPRRVWAYRDWVINALNRDLPYDQFIIEQIAGDLLPERHAGSDRRHRFLRNSMINEEGGIDPEQFRMEAMFDRMDAIGKGILGLTIQCAQCHTHKYDPLSQEEYYRMFAFLNNFHEANIAVYTPEEQMKRPTLFREISEIETDLKHRNPDWPEQMAAWEEERPRRSARVDRRPARRSKTIRRRPEDTSAATTARSSRRATHRPSTRRNSRSKTNPKTITAIRLELLNDPNLPLGGPGRSIKGTCALTEFRVEAAPADEPDKPERQDCRPRPTSIRPKRRSTRLRRQERQARVTGPVGFAIDGKDETAWGIDIGPGRRNVPRKAVFVAEKPVAFPGGTMLIFSSTRTTAAGTATTIRTTTSADSASPSRDPRRTPSADPLPATSAKYSRIPASKRSPEQIDAVFGYWRTTVPNGRRPTTRIEALWRSIPKASIQLVLEERD